jgi:hypothetical protein
MRRVRRNVLLFRSSDPLDRARHEPPRVARVENERLADLRRPKLNPIVCLEIEPRHHGHIARSVIGQPLPRLSIAHRNADAIVTMVLGISRNEDAVMTAGRPHRRAGLRSSLRGSLLERFRAIPSSVHAKCPVPGYTDYGPADPAQSPSPRVRYCEWGSAPRRVTAPKVVSRRDAAPPP